MLRFSTYSLLLGAIVTSFLACKIAYCSTRLLEFNNPTPGTLLDSTGQGVGFTHRLPGSGAGIATIDPNLTLDSANGHLLINSTRSDFNVTGFGRNLSVMEAPAIFFSGLGGDDFIVRAKYVDLHVEQASDQIGVFVGTTVDNVVRGGVHEAAIPLGTYQSNFSWSQNGRDGSPSGGELGVFQPGDNAIFELGRIGGEWHFSWQNLNSPQLDGIVENFTIPGLDFQNDLYFGVFNHDARNTTPQLATLDYFEVLTGNSIDVFSGPSSIYWTDVSDSLGTNDVIKRANADGTGIQTLINGIRDPRGMTIDSQNEKMYWTEPGLRNIRRANLDGTGAETVVSDSQDAGGGIALDLVHEKMYWTQGVGSLQDGRIRRADLDGSNAEDLLVFGPSHPVGIAVDPLHGKMYWTDLATDKIQWANLDGSDVQDLVTEVDEANGIAIDPIGGKIYWPELTTHKIQRANLDGSDVEDLVVGLDNPTTIGLDLGERKIYWTDVLGSPNISNRIERANLDGSEREVILSDVGVPWGIAVAQGLTFNPADINGDGLVNAVDAGIMFSNWGIEGGVFSQGNIDGRKFISASDAGIMFENWTADAAPVIPEPTTILLAIIGMISTCSMRHNRECHT